MVERLKQAIEKARVAGGFSGAKTTQIGQNHPHGKTALPARSEFDWCSIPEVALDPLRMRDARLSAPSDPSEVTQIFERLNTRLTRLCDRNDWRRIALTAPTNGCGTTTFAVQLALSLALRGHLRVVLVDLNLELPAIARRLGLGKDQNLCFAHSQARSLETSLHRLGANLLIAANAAPVGPEVTSRPEVFCGSVLERLESVLRPDIILLDLPPVLESDDTSALLSLADAALLVASADRTNAPDVEESARMIKSATSYLGVALNRSQGRMVRRSQRELA